MFSFFTPYMLNITVLFIITLKHINFIFFLCIAENLWLDMIDKYEHFIKNTYGPPPARSGWRCLRWWFTDDCHHWRFWIGFWLANQAETLSWLQYGHVLCLECRVKVTRGWIISSPFLSCSWPPPSWQSQPMKKSLAASPLISFLRALLVSTNEKLPGWGYTEDWPIGMKHIFSERAHSADFTMCPPRVNDLALFMQYQRADRGWCHGPQPVVGKLMRKGRRGCCLSTPLLANRLHVAICMLFNPRGWGKVLRRGGWGN